MDQSIADQTPGDAPNTVTDAVELVLLTELAETDCDVPHQGERV